MKKTSAKKDKGGDKEKGEKENKTIIGKIFGKGSKPEKTSKSEKDVSLKSPRKDKDNKDKDKNNIVSPPSSQPSTSRKPNPLPEPPSSSPSTSSPLQSLFISSSPSSSSFIDSSPSTSSPLQSSFLSPRTTSSKPLPPPPVPSKDNKDTTSGQSFEFKQEGGPPATPRRKGLEIGTRGDTSKANHNNNNINNITNENKVESSGSSDIVVDNAKQNDNSNTITPPSQPPTPNQPTPPTTPVANNITTPEASPSQQAADVFAEFTQRNKVYPA